jgi:putative hydrolase of the HAD superfamily
MHEHQIKAFLFDFGGVIAEEGFRNGLMAIAHSAGMDADSFFGAANESVYDSGYVVGTGNEEDFWNILKQKTGLQGNNDNLRSEILNRFIVRDWMIDVVRYLRRERFICGILSDQTNWLDYLDSKYGFYKEFDCVFNSFHLGFGKKDPRIFTYVADQLHLKPQDCYFIDDNPGNIERAASVGMPGHLYVDRDGFMKALKQQLPNLAS